MTVATTEIMLITRNKCWDTETIVPRAAVTVKIKPTIPYPLADPDRAVWVSMPERLLMISVDVLVNFSVTSVLVMFIDLQETMILLEIMQMIIYELLGKTAENVDCPRLK